MKTILLIPMLATAIMLTPMGFGETVTISTDKPFYESGDVVKMIGQVKDGESNNISGQVYYVVITPDGLSRIKIGYMDVSNGSFSGSFPTGGPLWKLNGEYLIQINFKEAQYSTSFEYTGGEMQANPEPIEIEVQPEQSPEPIIIKESDDEVDRLKSENTKLKVENKQLKNQINQLQGEIQRLNEKIDVLVDAFVVNITKIQEYFHEKYES